MKKPFLIKRKKAPTQSLFSMFKFLTLVIALLLFGVCGVQGQTFSGTFSFSGTTGNVSSLAYNGTAITNLTVSSLVKTGVTTSSSTGNSRATGWPTGSTNGGAAGGSVDLAKYYEFTITGAIGYTITNPTLSFGVGRSATGTRRFEWRSSLDTFNSPISVGTANASLTNTSGVLESPDANAGYTGNVISITSSGQNSITFRFYAYGAESGSGTGGLQGDFTFGGTLSSSNPTIIATGTLNPFVVAGISTPSTEQTFTVSGSNLVANLILTSPTGYQVSTTSGSGFGSSVSLAPSGGTVSSTTIYARFNPNALSDQVGGNIVCTSTSATTQNIAVSGEVTNLNVGDLAFIAFQGSTPDLFRMVALNSIPEGTRVYLTDKGWDGSLGTPAFLSGEGSGVWTAPAGGVSQGTVISFDADAGTASIGTGGIQSGLGSGGEQLFAFQGTLENPTFVAGFTSGSTISSGTPSGTQTWVPSALTDGTNYVALGTNVGASSISLASNIRILADQRTYIHNNANWITQTSGSWPTYSFVFLSNEPTSQGTFTASSAIGNNQMTLNFSGGDGASYLVVMRKTSAVSAVPVDGTAYSTNTSTIDFTTAFELSSGERIVYNGPISNTSITVTNLAAGSDYHYAIYSYNGSSTTTNYLTTSPGTGNTSTTGSSNSSTSDIIVHASFTEPSNIAYHSYQENSDLTNLNSIEVAKFTLRDGGASSPDADAQGTTLTAITFTVSNHTLLRRLAIYNGSTEIAEIAVSSGSAVFSGFSLSASDDGNQDFSIRASFAATVTDNEQFSFTVNSVTANPSGSTFLSSDGGAAASLTTGDRNKIEVTATLLSFVQQPSSTSVNTAISPSVTVSANDALTNRDLDYITDMTATTSGTFAGASTNTITPTAGLGTFSNLQFSVSGSITINIGSGSLTSTGNSSSFNVTTSIEPGDIAFINYQSDAPDGFSIITFVDIPASQTFYFTDNGWTTSSGPLTATENTMVWSTPASVISAGTVIQFSNSTGSVTTVSPSGNGTASSALSGLSASGDQILMYRGTSGSPDKFICALNFGNSGAWVTSGSISSNTSYLPSDLTDNINAISFPSDLDNGYYGNTQSGSIASLKALINKGENWTRDNNTLTEPTWSFIINATTTTISADATVQNLGIGSGETFEIGANTLTINGAVSGSGTITGGVASNLIIGGAAGTIQLTSGSTNNYLKNLTLNASSTITIGSNGLNITGGASSGVVSVGAGSALTTGGNLTLKADASGTASIGAIGAGGSITGNVTVETYIPGSKRAFRLMGHPFSSAMALSSLIDDIHITGTGGASNGFDPTTTNNGSAFSFNESAYSGATNSGWSAYTATSNTIGKGEGFRILYRGPRTQSNLLDGTNPIPDPATLDFTGAINQGDVVVAMSYTGASGANAGWNLLSNPYPSKINIGGIASGNRNGISAFSVWAPNNGTRGAYITTSFGSSYIIPASSAFFVQTGSAANFTFTEADKTSSAVSAILLKTDPFKLNALQLNVLSDDTIFWDQFVLRNRTDASEARDAMDAAKMQNPDVNFYSLSSTSEKFAIDHRPIAENKVVNLGFESTSDYHFTFKVDFIDMPEYDVYLMDKFLSKQTLLTANTAYNFTTTSDANSKGTDRFQLVFAKSVNSISEISSINNFIVYPNPATAQINIVLNQANAGNYNFSLVNQLGQEIKNGNFNFNSNSVQTLNIEELTNGVYFIKITNGESNQTIKFIK